MTCPSVDKIRRTAKTLCTPLWPGWAWDSAIAENIVARNKNTIVIQTVLLIFSLKLGFECSAVGRDYDYSLVFSLSRVIFVVHFGQVTPGSYRQQVFKIASCLKHLYHGEYIVVRQLVNSVVHRLGFDLG